MITEFPSSSRPYLIELSARLYGGHATVMIGAGFSKNAIKNDHTKDGFPSWFELGNAFYEKLYGNAPDKNNNYLNALKLAEEVEAAFGRPVLDQMLRALIPDNDHQPAEIHSKLLSLPWTDIFTTNYDTLLERASQTVLNQKYDLVINKSDLVYAEQPRIIKLHGSFPSERPLIITEEDYRTYPKKFAPFVNTVQQSLIENTLCLIGFSGDDPNFLSWIGWILDNLGRENSPKIYLVGIINLTDAQQKLLATKNIVIVDLVEKGNHDHYAAIDRLLNFLASEDKKDIYINWPENERYLDGEGRTEEILQSWVKTRVQYPNWLILPRKQRDRLWQQTQYYINSLEGKDYPTNSTLDLEIFYELNWRLEKCLCPILNNLIPDYEKIIRKYSHEFLDSISRNENIEGGRWKLKNKWVELMLALLRFYREEHLLEKWEILDQTLSNIEKELQPEQTAKLWYERCLEKLSRLLYSELNETLAKWPVNTALPYWEAKRATMLAETGQGEKAMNILASSLINIRTRLQLSPVVNDYTWVSVEAYLMVLFSYIKQYNLDNNSSETYNQDSHFTKRTDHLKIYKCDPAAEIDAFTMMLSPEPVNSDTGISYDFELGRSNQTVSFGKESADVLLGYNYLRFIEEIGLPPILGNLTYGQKPLIGAVKRIAEASTYLAMSSLVRSANKNAVKEIFKRELIRDLPLSTISELISTFIETSENMFNELSSDSLFKPSLMQVIIPEMLSKLATRCQATDREKMLSFLLRIYNSHHRIQFKGCAEMMSRLIWSMTPSEKMEKFNILLAFPMIDNEWSIDDFPDPFTFVSVFTNSIEGPVPEIERSFIRTALKKSMVQSKHRHKGLIRLGTLDRLGVLNPDEKKEFAKILWSQIQPNGFPDNTSYRPFSFVHLPHPTEVNPEALFKTYLQNQKIPIHKGQNQLGITGGKIDLFNELLDGTWTKINPIGVKWTSEEITIWLDKLINWWESDKQFLKPGGPKLMFSSKSREFERRFANLSRVLNSVISEHSFWKENIAIQQSIRTLITDMGAHNIPITSLQIVFIKLFPECHGEIAQHINTRYAAEEHENIVDAANSMIDVIKDDKIETQFPELLEGILDMVTGSIKWRDLKRLEVATEVLKFCIQTNHKSLNSKHLNNIIFGLSKLIIETGNGKPDIHINEKLINRKQSAKLANYLFHYYPEIDQTIIEKWKAITDSEEEFTEIRKQWKTIKPSDETL